MPTSKPDSRGIKSGPALYPFSAIVGQEEMTLALMIAAVDPLIGGVLIMGHRGTGKSTAVRALAELLPPIPRVKGCLYGCDPAVRSGWCDACRSSYSTRQRVPRETSPVRVVELPLGATEDRVCGSLDFERALAKGVKAFEPGLLARANRAFLYIDEVNLLEDHLVDLLLDVAASGRHIVEREGVSVSHPARFALIGSGNPEEGELRPQLLDRFGLYARIGTIADIDVRVEIVRRRQRFDADPAGFLAEMEPQQARSRDRIVRARQVVGSVLVSDELLYQVAGLCSGLGVDGHRGELAVLRAAKAVAALEGRPSASASDVQKVAPMCLRHRLRKDAFGEVDPGIRVQQAVSRVLPKPLEPGSAPQWKI